MCAAGDECVDHFEPVFGLRVHRHVQWREETDVSNTTGCVWIRAGLEQDLNDLHVTATCRQHQSGEANAVQLFISVSSCLQQPANFVDATRSCSLQQRRQVVGTLKYFTDSDLEYSDADLIR